MAFGDAILNLLGRPDPRRQLLEGTLRAQGGGSTPQPAAGAPGTDAAPQQQQPTAYQSPPQLLELYDSLLNRSTRERRMDTGIGLMASSFARPENRDSIMQAATGEYESPSDVFSLVQGLQTAQMEAEQRQQLEQKRKAQLEALPGIAEKYGLNPEVAGLLFDNEQLDDFVMKAEEFTREAAKPDNEVVEMPDGSKAVVNKNNPTQPIQIAPSAGNTTDWKTYNGYAAQEKEQGRVPLSFNEWDLQARTASAPKTNINNSPLGGADLELTKGLDAGLLDEFKTAPDKVRTVETIQQARRQLDAAGGVISGDMTAPIQLETMKVMTGLFGGDTTAITNTETFQSQMKNLVLPLVKQLGTGNSISNADREFVEKAIGGTITLDEGAARRILDIVERGQRRELLKTNSKMKRRIEQSAADSPLRQAQPSYLDVPLSPEYIERVTADVPDGDEALLVQNIDNKVARREFDEAYGGGASRDVYEALTGVDPGPLEITVKGGN